MKWNKIKKLDKIKCWGHQNVSLLLTINLHYIPSEKKLIKILTTQTAQYILPILSIQMPEWQCPSC